MSSTNENDYVYGKGGRIKSAPDPLLINSAYKHDCSYAKYLMAELNKVDIAYAIMLIDKKIIPESNGLKLLEGLKQIEKVDYNEYLNPKYGDIYNCKEVYLKSLIGEENAGWLHIGRPRREAINLAFLITLRTLLIEFAEQLLNLAKVFVDKSLEEINTVMPDYTYLQHANPTTFGHYILTYLFPLLRDFDRITSYYDRLNTSPAGSGSVNGSSLPLDREFLKELLGFDKITAHSRDGMWQPDLPIELMSIICMAFSNINRFTDELQIWNSFEFSLITLPDSLCRTSVIMPQKKNPYPLAYFRGLTNSFLGKLTSAISYGKVFSGNPDSRVFNYTESPESLILANEALPLIAKLIDEMVINKERANELTLKGFSFASDLSEYLSSTFNIDYKTSHHITGNIVNRVISNEVPELNAKLLESTILQFTGKKVVISSEELSSKMKPLNIINSRITEGSASIPEVKKIIKEAKTKIETFESWITKVKTNNNLELLNTSLNKKLK